MPHQCVRCNKFYDDGAAEILKGCDCGARMFFYIKKSKMEEAKQEVEELKLTEDQKVQIEEDVREMLGDKLEEDNTVVLDIESVRILRPGKYELDLVQLFKGEPIVYKLEEGKYMVDLRETFDQLQRKKKHSK